MVTGIVYRRQSGGALRLTTHTNYCWVKNDWGCSSSPSLCVHGVDSDNSSFRSLQVIFVHFLRLVLSIHSNWLLYFQWKGLITISHSDMKYSYCIVLLFYDAFPCTVFDWFRESLPLLVQTAVMVWRHPELLRQPPIVHVGMTETAWGCLLYWLRSGSVTGYRNCSNWVNKGVALCVF
jgi:hypothetical protein